MFAWPFLHRFFYPHSELNINQAIVLSCRFPSLDVNLEGLLEFHQATKGISEIVLVALNIDKFQRFLYSIV